MDAYNIRSIANALPTPPSACPRIQHYLKSVLFRYDLLKDTSLVKLVHFEKDISHLAVPLIDWYLFIVLFEMHYKTHLLHSYTTHCLFGIKIQFHS